MMRRQASRPNQSNATALICIGAGLLGIGLSGCTISVPSSGQGECEWNGDEIHCVADGEGGSDSEADGGADAGTTTGAGGETNGNPSAPSNDSCANPQMLDLGAGQYAFAHGTFEGATDDLKTFCADNSEATSLPDVVYQLNLASECTVKITIDGPTGLDGVISLRSQDCTVDEYCVDHPGTHESFKTALDAGVYWIVVSNAGTEQSNFTLAVDCAIPKCGDGIRNAAGQEQCDDGNTLNGDGCSSDCRYEASELVLDTCEGAASAAPHVIATGEVLRLPGELPMRSTIGATDSGTGSCQLQPDGEFVFAAPDHVYRIRPESNGLLRLTLGLGLNDEPLCGTDPNGPHSPFPAGCYDRAIHVREATCTNAGAEVGCSDNAYDWWAQEEVLVSVSAGTDYYVFVDGWNDDDFGAGLYALRAELQ